MAQRCAIFLLFLAATVSRLVAPAQALPIHADHHPRLFFDADEAPALRLAIESDPERLAVWEETRARAALHATLAPDSLLSYYWGFQEVEELALVACLDDSIPAAEAEQTIESALAWLVDTQGPAPDPGHGVLGTAMRLHTLLWGYDHAFSGADEATRQAVVDEILLYLESITADLAFTQFLHNPLVSNKGVTLGAQLQLADLLLSDDLPPEHQPLLASARALGDSLLDKAWADLFGVDGSYREGIGYMLWSMRTLLPTWEARARLEGSDPLQASRADALLEWLAYQMLGDGTAATLNRNDSNSADYLVSRHHTLMEWATSRGNSPELARWMLRRCSGDLGHDFGHESDPMATLLWHQDGPETAPALAPERFFADRGLYVYRQGWPGDPLEETFLLTLEGGEFKGGHAQEDVGQITLRAMGHGFALDHGAGLVAKQTEAHNLPLVDDRGQHNAGASIGTDGETRVRHSSSFCTIVSVDMSRAYSTYSPYNAPDMPWAGWDWSWGYDGGNPASLAERTLLLFPGSGDPAEELPALFLEDAMVMVEPGEHVFRWRLHMDAGLNFTTPGSEEWRLSGAGGEMRLFLHDPPIAEVYPGASMFDNGNPEPDSRRFSCTWSGEAFRFLWQWTPLAVDHPVPERSTERLAEGLRMVSLREGRERRVLRRDGQAPLTASGDHLDGKWGVIEKEGDQTRSLLLEGRRLRSGGHLLIGLEPGGSASWDGQVVLLSAPDLDFKVYAPGATQVLCGDQSIAFEQRGDYVSRVANPEHELPDISAQQPHTRDEAPIAGEPPYRIRFSEAMGSGARLSIYDVRGRLVRELESAPGDAADFHWDGRDARGLGVASGVYLLRRQGGDRSTTTRKLLVLR